MGTKIIMTTDKIVPIKTKGVRLPRLVLMLSDHLPKMGRRNKDSTLSMPMTTPRKLLERPKARSKRRGTTKSYAVQKSIMMANAKPTLIVLL